MGWIAERIKAEHRKHSGWSEEWEEIAECKIKAELIDRGMLKEDASSQKSEVKE